MHIIRSYKDYCFEWGESILMPSVSIRGFFSLFYFVSRLLTCFSFNVLSASRDEVWMPPQSCHGIQFGVAHNDQLVNGMLASSRAFRNMLEIRQRQGILGWPKISSVQI